MDKTNKCVNCGKDPRTNLEFLPCYVCGRVWFAKCKTLEELANEADLRDNQMADFVPEEMAGKQIKIQGRIFYLERGLSNED